VFTTNADEKPILAAVCVLGTILISFNATLLADYVRRTSDLKDDMKNKSEESALLLSQITECMMGGQVFGANGGNKDVQSLLYFNYNNIKIMLIFWFSLFGCLVICPLCIVCVVSCRNLTKNNITTNCAKYCEEFKHFLNLYMRVN